MFLVVARPLKSTLSNSWSVIAGVRNFAGRKLSVWRTEPVEKDGGLSASEGVLSLLHLPTFHCPGYSRSSLSQ